MALPGVFYNLVARRFSTLLLATAGGAYFLDLTLNGLTDAYWNSNNKGKLWKDIKGKLADQ